MRLRAKDGPGLFGGGFSCSKGMANDGDGWDRRDGDGRDEKHPATLIKLMHGT